MTAHITGTRHSVGADSGTSAFLVSWGAVLPLCATGKQWGVYVYLIWRRFLSLVPCHGHANTKAESLDGLNDLVVGEKCPSLLHLEHCSVWRSELRRLNIA